MLDGNNYGTKEVVRNGSSGFTIFWVPLEPGEYSIKTFLVSDWHDPQIASTVATAHVEVFDKIDALGEGEGNGRLQLVSLNTANRTVQIAYSYCDEIPPYMHETEDTLRIGDYVVINSVDAILMGVKDDKAIFRFAANGGSDFCLL